MSSEDPSHIDSIPGASNFAVQEKTFSLSSSVNFEFIEPSSNALSISLTTADLDLNLGKSDITQTDTEEPIPFPAPNSSQMSNPQITIDEPSGEEPDVQPQEMVKELAKSLYNGTFRSVSIYEAASWIGNAGEERRLVREAFMEIFDWAGLSVLGAIRGLCNKLYMKAESQQLDRIVDAFSERWCKCNPNHGFKATSVIYTLAYSILLLNTDHHSEEYSASKKMPRSQYVQSTLQAMSALAVAEGESSIKKPVSSSSKTISASDGSYHNFSTRRRVASNENGSTAENTALVYVSSDLSMKEWETTLSGLLKSIYASVDITPLSLAQCEKELRRSISASSVNRLSLIEGGSGIFPRRSWIGSSDTWSDYEYSDAVANNHVHSARRSMYSGNSKLSYRNSTIGGISGARDHNIGFAGALWSNIIREEQEKDGISENNEIITTDTHTSKLSPQDSKNSLRTSQNASTDRLSLLATTNSSAHSENQVAYPTINDIARNDISITSSGRLHAPDSIYSSSQGSLEYSGPLNEEALTLNGAPWAKEGLLKFQAFFEKDATPKRYKKQGWTGIFVVVQSGYLKMFQFNKTPSKKKSMNLASIGRKSKICNSQTNETTATQNQNIGNGNWTTNATLIDSISLCHTVAQIIHIAKDGTDLLGVLPGSSSKMTKKTNLASHNGDNIQWSLKLPNGGVLAFLAGTREVADEFVYTCNYWAARVSREPLVEAVTSSEFGWGKPLDLIFGVLRKDNSNPSSASTLSSRVRSKSSTQGGPVMISVSSSINEPKAKALLHKKSAPTLSSSSKAAAVRQAHLNMRQTSQPLYKTHTATPSVNSTVSSVLSRSSGGGANILRKSLLKPAPGSSSVYTTSAAIASASATAAATSLLGINSSSLIQASISNEVREHGPKAVTAHHSQGGIVISVGSRRYFVASGSPDTMFMNNAIIQIKEWRPPVQSAVHSVLEEVGQLEHLNRYTLTVDEALQDHTSLRAELMTVFQPQLLVSQRVKANWEKRCNYLLSEAVKYDIYTSTLSHAIEDRRKVESQPN